MKSKISQEKLQETIAFHGHLCPGLMTGVRAAEIALREIGPRAADEELVAVVETDNCAVDAIQYLLGCTFGKGNLIHLDHGQSVFTIARRSEGERATAIRIAAKPRPSREMTPEQQALAERVRSGQASPEEEQAYAALWRERSLAILDMDEGDLFDVQVLDDYLVPERAGVHPSIRCERCGRMTMSTRVHRLRGQALCVPCFEQALEGAAIFYPIGVVRNELIAGEAAPRAKSSSSRLEIRPELIEALEGIEAFEQLEVLFYFDRAEKNPPLRQHRCGDPSQPLTGVLALRSPARPNAIGLSRVKLLAREENVLFVAGLDAWDGTPILDIKPFEGI